jgi:hypothetical protein
LDYDASETFQVKTKETTMTINPVSAAVAGALISGVAMYAVGPRAERVDAFAQPAYVETVDGRIVPVTPALQPAGVSSLQSGFVPVAQQVPAASSGAPQRTVYRTAAPAQDARRERDASGRSWKKTAMVIGGSTAGGAGVGAVVGGKKGALIGAALGGGAASIYEATKALASDCLAALRKQRRRNRRHVLRRGATPPPFSFVLDGLEGRGPRPRAGPGISR